MPKVSQDHKAEMRARLVDAAVAITVASGPASATTRRVLEAAGLSTGALYHYFASKEELFEAVAERFVELDDDLYPADLDRATGEQLVAHHRAVLAHALAGGQRSVLGPLRVASLSSEQVRRSLEHFDRASVERAEVAVVRSQEVGLFDGALDPGALVEVIAVFVEAFVTRDHLDAFVTSRRRVALAFLDMLCAAALDLDHPLAGELRRQLEEAIGS